MLAGKYRITSGSADIAAKGARSSSHHSRSSRRGVRSASATTVWDPSREDHVSSASGSYDASVSWSPVPLAHEVRSDMELLAEAGYPDGFELNLVNFKLHVWYHSHC